jgi:hypothetical protein
MLTSVTVLPHAALPGLTRKGQEPFETEHACQIPEAVLLRDRQRAAPGKQGLRH